MQRVPVDSEHDLPFSAGDSTSLDANFKLEIFKGMVGFTHRRWSPSEVVRKGHHLHRLLRTVPAELV